MTRTLGLYKLIRITSNRPERRNLGYKFSTLDDLIDEKFDVEMWQKQGYAKLNFVIPQKSRV
jgi:hypothetical protein